MTAHLGGAKDLTNLEAAPKEAFSNSNFADNKLASLDQSSHFNSSVNDGGLQPTTAQADTQYVAWDNSSAAFRPTLTGAQQMQMPASNAPAADPSSTMQTAQPTSSAPSTNSTSELARNSSGTSERGSLLGGRHTAGPETTSDASTTSDAGSASTAGDGATASGDMQPSSVDYTIKHGDNLWDIAHKHLGDATKWGDIYKMNQDVIGNNPSLIHEGAQLHLPGDGHLANADYVVKPGDNLWDISKSHMGGGEHWKDLYHGNEGAVGSNPDLIHPGQHLNMGHGDASGQLANSDVSAHAHHVAQPSAESAHHTVAHAPHHSVHLAHSHTPATHQLAHADHGQTVASAHPPAHSAQGQTVASSPAVGNGGEQVALKAAPAGSLAAAPGKFGQISGE
jgi:nucleoid-associated protein YgaU